MPESNLPSLRVKPGRQFPFLARHPWVHAHALAQQSDHLTCGDTVDLVDIDGNFLGRGLVNPSSKLRVRLYTYKEGVEVDEAFWRGRIDAAIARRRLSQEDRDRAETGRSAERLIFSEADLISGLIVDRYADCLGIQFTSGALLRWRETILDHLSAVCQPRQMVVRVDERTAKHEAVPAESATLVMDAESTLPPVAYQQNGLELTVDLVGGQKTGGYLDQRQNHAVVAGYCNGKRVLDVCCYTGGFGLAAAKAGASHVTAIDSSEPALEAARQSAERNGVAEKMQFLQDDCFNGLGRLRDQGEQFDVVVLDPPRFAGSRHQIDQAMRAYRRLNGLALSLLPPGGILVTCSCSGRVSRSDFLNMLVDVGRRETRDIIVMENRGPSPDHPMAVGCPESNYLKCIIAQVT